MTILLPVPMTCAVCAFTSERIELRSTSSFTLPDLDTRPGELARSTIGFWIQRCYRCGYCAPRVTDTPPPDIREILEDPNYRKTLADERFTAGANDFLARGLIDERLGNLIAAGWNAVRAAWLCDDAGRVEAAILCRSRAVDLFRRALAEGQEVASDGGGPVVLADLLRRSGRFDEAIAECEAALSLDQEEKIRSMLAYEVQLARAGDDGCHNVSEVPAEPRGMMAE